MRDWRSIRVDVIQRDKNRCRACGRPTVGQVHHIVPRRLGGSSRLSNLMTLCGKCHVLVSPVPDWVIKKVWKLRESEIPRARRQVHDAIARYCLQRRHSSATHVLETEAGDRMDRQTELSEWVRWINAYLSILHGSETRISSVLMNLGYNADQIRLIRSQGLSVLVSSFMWSVTDRLLSHTDGERLFLILRQRLRVDGTKVATLQELAGEFGISRERVRQLETKVIRRCRHRTNRVFVESTLRELANTVLGDSQVSEP